ncbi:hypothetical protein TWF730_008135 [Orbilia blumenaviensis]|uniref:Uncharacterized protein n=1 Tax=Orbilia blumenaviensis TaxID=1796055 RepID=A0AAV9V9Z4_9PEZI
MGRRYICAGMFKSRRRYPDNINIFKGHMKVSCCKNHGEKILRIDVYAGHKWDQFQRALDSLAVRNFLEYTGQRDKSCQERVYRLPDVVAHWLQGLDIISVDFSRDLVVVAGYLLYESLMVEQSNDVTDACLAYLPSAQETSRPLATCLLHHFQEVAAHIVLLDTLQKNETSTQLDNKNNSSIVSSMLSPRCITKIFLKISRVLSCQTYYDESKRVADTVYQWLKKSADAIIERFEAEKIGAPQTEYRRLMNDTKFTLGCIALDGEDYTSAEAHFNDLLKQGNNILDQKCKMWVESLLYEVKIQQPRLSEPQLSALLSELLLLKKECDLYNYSNIQPHPQTVSIRVSILSIYQMQTKFRDALREAEDCRTFLTERFGTGNCENLECIIYGALIDSCCGHIYYQSADRQSVDLNKLIDRHLSKQESQQWSCGPDTSIYEKNLREEMNGFKIAASCFLAAAEKSSKARGEADAHTLNYRSDLALAEFRMDHLKDAIETNLQILKTGLITDGSSLNLLRGQLYPTPKVNVGKWAHLFWASIYLRLAIAHWVLYKDAISDGGEQQQLNSAVEYICRAKGMYDKMSMKTEIPVRYEMIGIEINKYSNAIDGSMRRREKLGYARARLARQVIPKA